MSKVRNYHVWSDQTTINRLKEEYTFLGRYCTTPEPGHLVVHALPPKRQKKKDSKDQKSRRGSQVDKSEGRTSDKTARGHGPARTKNH